MNYLNIELLAMMLDHLWVVNGEQEGCIAAGTLHKTVCSSQLVTTEAA